MKFTVRKFVVGLFSLALLLAVFLLYNRYFESRPKGIDLSRQFVDTIPDGNVGGSIGQAGTIAGVEVVAVKETRFLHRNKDNKVDREFGFQELLHESGDQWEIEKPYMNMFLPSLTCSVTADKGNVQVESAFGRPTPNDSTFSGNVVIHIMPIEPSSVKESLIYLDDLVFVSNKSLFSSSGSVRFISESARLVGRGLELLYDDTLGRLELFRINSLQSLQLRSSDFGSLSGGAPRVARTGEPSQNVSSVEPQDRDSRKVQTQVRAPALPSEEKPGESYKCEFFENVVVRTSAQLIVAEDELSISDIFWRNRSPSRMPSHDSKETDGSLQGDNIKTPDRVASASDRLQNLSEDLFDIVITCDGGAVIAPTESLRVQVKPEKVIAAGPKVPPRTIPIAEGFNQTLFSARNIDHNASSGDAVARGPVQLSFCVDMNNIGDGKSTGPASRVTVTAKNEARFLASSNQIIFDGNCACTMFRTELNAVVEYRIWAPKLILDISPSADTKSSLLSASLLHVATEGGEFKSTMVRKAAGKILGGVQLEGRRLDYDACERLLIAAGPGLIKLNNPGGSDAGHSGFSLRRPCYAFLRDFDRLQYFLEPGRLVAEAASHRILLDYFPVANGRYGPQARAVVGHVEAQFTQTSEQTTELASLIASRGITYEDDTNQFAGSSLAYNFENSTMNITGDQEQPCYFNGALVDSIEINLKTGKIKAQVPAPSILQLNK